MPSNFEIAALDAVATTRDVAEERTAEVTLNKRYVSLWRRPTPGQYAMFQLRASRSSGSQQAHAIDVFFSKLILTPAEIVEEGRVNQDGEAYADLAESGEITPIGMEFLIELIESSPDVDEDFLFDMLREAIEIHSGFPTSSGGDSSPSRKRTGSASTASSRRVRSTPSP